jgi:cyclophilin family peptidyl-prolyl cis-trans isomerase
VPHSSKKYRKQETKPPHPNLKWYIVAVIVIVGLVFPTLYFTYPPVQSAVLYTVRGFSNPSSNPYQTGSSNSSTSLSTSSSLCASGCVYAKINTSQGMIEVELFKGLTPKTVNNFVQLANSGFYNNLVWHRIVQGFVIQTGDPNTRNGQGDQSTWGTGGSNTSVPLEAVASLHNYAGFLAMAHTAASTSATSQFYINLVNNTGLDGQYTVFGKVISGMNVVNAIAALPVNSNSVPTNPLQAMMLSVTIQSSP